VDPILEVEDVHKHFDTGLARVEVLSGVSFEAGRGEFLAVMGASGSGKSTLLHLVAGLEPPTRGRIRIDGQALDQLSDRQRTLRRRDQIGFVFQNYNLLASLTVRENVALPLVIAGRRPTRHESRIDEVLAHVHLTDRADHRPDALSGGEQQRVAIARALLMRPALMLADEPTGNLDTASRRDVYALLRRLAERDGQTIVMVTHDPSGAAMADRVLFIKDGRLVGQMRPEDHEHAQAVARSYQGFVESPGTDDRDDAGRSV
jgi:putative ABC transport system ATP-binding protein